MNISNSTNKVSLLIRFGMPILKLLSGFILLVREFGEEVGEGISERFIKNSYSNKKSEKIKYFGKKTGELIAILMTFGVLGSYIVDISETNNSSENDNADKKEAHVANNNWEEVDINNKDGVPDGYDTNGDGVIDTNLNGVPLGDLQEVSGYTKGDGVYVDSYVRTEADSSIENNIRT